MALNFDPYEPKQYARLQKVLKYNYKELKPFRNVRRLNIEAARGHYYRTEDDDPTAERGPVNLMNQFVQILVRSFVQNNPTARVTSRTNRKAAAIFQEHLNITIREIKLVDTLRRSVMEAILGYMGIAYCNIELTENDPDGEVFTAPISLPNYVIDLAHDEFHEVDLMGHRFARRIGELRDDPKYDQEVVAKLKGRRSGLSELDDRQNAGGYNEDEGSLFDWVDIWALLIKPVNQVVYMVDQAELSVPLRVESYDGPEFGPYPLLGFDRVLDELIPNSPGAIMLDMHEFVQSEYTRIFMKEDQAAEFWTYEGGSEEDARRVRDAMDGQMVQVNNNAAVQRRTKGGTSPQALAVAIHGRQLFDELSGQIRRFGGVSSNADTATEARIDHANTSQLIRDMQLQVVAFTKQILQNIAWYEWTHPSRTRRVELKVGRGGNAVSEMWSPEMREGDFIEHEIDIVPDSMEHRSSRQQLNELMTAVNGVVIPAMQMPSERPVVLKTPELLQKYSELANLPELAEVADYALDESFVSRPPVTGASRAPAGDAQDVGAGPSRSTEDAFVERVFSGAVSGTQESEG
jgi:hypothetical protein